jgi:hypothetical protein
MARQRAPRRADQIVSTGFGQHFISPLKKRDKKKSNTFVRAPLQDMKRKLLLAKLAILHAPPPSPLASPDASFTLDNTEVANGTSEVESPLLDDQPTADITDDNAPGEERPSRRRIVPNEADARLYHKWLDLLPHLVDPFLQYLASTTGSTLRTLNNIHSRCMQSCLKSSTNILCLYFDRKA